MREQQYRLLNVGETIPEGAEHYINLLWVPAEHAVGNRLCDSHAPTRVPIEPEPSGWVKCSKRMPTLADGGAFDGYLPWLIDGEVASYSYKSGSAAEKATHWHPAPKPPEPEPDAFEEWWRDWDFDEPIPEAGQLTVLVARAAWDAAKKEGAQ